MVHAKVVSKFQLEPARHNDSDLMGNVNTRNLS